MKHPRLSIFKSAATSLAMFLLPLSAMSQTLAFPGAEGFGRFATGGRTGTVYHVTNLNDTGAGSFRDAVSKPNRIVVFDVAGVIRITSRISVAANIYIAGQTAPGEGVTIYGNGISFSNADNTICRYLRVRQGAVGTHDSDAAGISSGRNMIFDHCSFAWGRDEVFSISGSNPQDITVQNCIIGQGLMGHSAGGLIQTDNRVTIFRTLHIHNDTRNPKFKGRHQYVNNIVYNWKTAAYIMGGDSEGTSYANAVGNLFITGPTGKQNAFSGANARYNIYAHDNMLDGDHNGVFNPRAISRDEFGGGPTFQEQPYDYPELPTIGAIAVLDQLKDNVGASLPYRDPLDWMLISDLKSLGNEGEIISNEADLDIGAPTTWNLWPGSDDNRTDSDGDGMPDWWEQQNGTNPQADDAMTIADDGYANIEHYINSIGKEQSQYFLKTPMALKAIESTQETITLRWRDFTDHEEGYAIEQLIDGNWQEIGRTLLPRADDQFTVVNLTPSTQYSFRVRAFYGDTYSEYSNQLTAKTKAPMVDAIDPDSYMPDLTWTGATSNLWNTTDANWKEGNYHDNSRVLFDGNGQTGDIIIPEEVSPEAIMVKGNADYHFNGVIAGQGSVNMAGEGTLQLDDNNTYAGGTVLWNGTLNIGKIANGGMPSSIGTAQTWIWNGGTVNYTGPSASTNREAALQGTTTVNVSNPAATLTLTGQVSGEGTLVKDGEGTLSQAYGLHSYTGNTIVRGGTYELRGKDLLGNMPAINGTLILEGGRFRTTGGDSEAEGYLNFPIVVRGDKESFLDIGKRTNVKNSVSGTGNLTVEIEFVREFFQGDWSNFFGTVTAKKKASDGTQFYIDNATYGGIPNGRLVLDGAFEMRAGSNSKEYHIGALAGDGQATLACCFVKKDGGKVTWHVGALGTDETFNGKITNGIEHTSRIGTTSLVKEGDGNWTLTGAQKYRGTTLISGGTLTQNGVHQKDKDHTGTYFTPGAYTVAEGATLAGTGSTLAPVIVESGATLSPGDNGLGTFTVGNSVNLKQGATLAMEVDANTKESDKLACQGTLTANGTLRIIMLNGTPAEGDSYNILNAQAISGNFDAIVPAEPADGLCWDTSQLATTGRLIVASATGIVNHRSASDVVRTEQFTINGSRTAPSAPGLLIIRKTHADGTVTIEKKAQRKP